MLIAKVAPAIFFQRCPLPSCPGDLTLAVRTDTTKRAAPMVSGSLRFPEGAAPGVAMRNLTKPLLRRHRPLLPLLLLVLLPAGRPAWAGGGGAGVSGYEQLLEARRWRWFTDDEAARPTPLAQPDQPLSGVEERAALRLRYQVACNAPPDLLPAACQPQSLLLQQASGAWSCVEPAPLEELGQGSPWSWADGRGMHGQPLPVPLLPGSEVAAFFVEERPLGLGVELITPQIAEWDFSLRALPLGWQPNTRHVFLSAQTDGQGQIREACLHCLPPSLCTRAGPPQLAAEPLALRWTFDLPHRSPVHVLDWDGDGLEDLLAGAVLGSPVLFLNRTAPNDAGPRFAAGRLLPLPGRQGAEPVRCAGVDWDGDDDADIVAGMSNREVWLYRNEGGDRFTVVGPLLEPGPDGQPQPLSECAERSGDHYCTADLVDWNRDGLVDLVMPSSTGRLALWLNPGERGTTTMGPKSLIVVLEPALLANATVVQMLDFDGDGLRDLVAGLHDGSVMLVLDRGTPGQPDFSRSPMLNLLASQQPRAGVRYLALLEPWPDDRRVLVVGETRASVQLYAELGRTGSAVFANAPLPVAVVPPPGPPAGGARVLFEEPYQPAASPVRHDLLVGLGDGSTEVWLGVGQPELAGQGTGFGLGVRVPLLPAAAGGGAVTPELGDADGDGLPDLLLGRQDGTVVWGRGEPCLRPPCFAAPVPLLAAGRAVGVAGPAVPRLADLDGDGLTDLLVGAGDGTVQLFRQAADGSRLPAVVLLQGEPGSRGLAVVDWDDDGRTDLLRLSPQGRAVLHRGQAGPPPLAGGGAALRDEQGAPLAAAAALLATDFFPLDCARDLVLATPDGALRIHPGHVPTPPAPDGLDPADDVDARDGAPLPVRPWLGWEPVVPPAGGRHRYEVELAVRSDFAALYDELASNDGAQRDEPTPRLTIAEPLEQGRRYFWRVRSFDEQLHPGYWS
ncbi:MAG: VCBS repeat-containing protein, partial [Deltaproteobacteria bacterium]|nr:VCBS repeat-containing protein [Deltaproteobacteria bacterium]